MFTDTGRYQKATAVDLTIKVYMGTGLALKKGDTKTFQVEANNKWQVVMIVHVSWYNME